jgi:hypothetical protein
VPGTEEGEGMKISKGIRVEIWLYQHREDEIGDDNPLSILQETAISAAGTSRTDVLEAALLHLPQDLASRLRKRLGPFVEGQEDQFGAHEATVTHRACLFVKPTEVIS